EFLGEVGNERGGLVGQVADLRQGALDPRYRVIRHARKDNHAAVHNLLLPSAALPHSPGAYIAIVLVGIGIGLIVIGALLLPFAAGIPSNEKSPPGGEAIEGGFSE